MPQTPENSRYIIATKGRSSTRFFNHQDGINYVPYSSTPFVGALRIVGDLHEIGTGFLLPEGQETQFFGRLPGMDRPKLIQAWRAMEWASSQKRVDIVGTLMSCWFLAGQKLGRIDMIRSVNHLAPDLKSKFLLARQRADILRKAPTAQTLDEMLTNLQSAGVVVDGRELEGEASVGRLYLTEMAEKIIESQNAVGAGEVIHPHGTIRTFLSFISPL